MANKILMPKLSPTMEEGQISRWLKAEGDEIEPNETIAEVDTDKATMEMTSLDGGTLLKILVPAGDNAKLGQTIGIIGKKGEDFSALLDDEPAAASSKKDAETRSPGETATSAPVAKAVSPLPAAVGNEQPATNRRQPSADDRLIVSPIAARMAAENGLDLKTIAGSGPQGRIIKRDIEAAIAGGTSFETMVSAPAFAASEVIGASAYREEPTSKMRKVIASRLAESIGPIPTFYLTVEIEMDNALEFRKLVNSTLPDDQKVSVNDILVKVAAAASKKHPWVNSSYRGDSVRFYEDADVGVAVAVEDGLITPVIRGANKKGVAAIAREVKELAALAREKKLQPEQYTGATFSISNLGMFGIKEFTAIINPPEAAILAIGGSTPTPVVRDGEVVVRSMMSVTMSCDHRVIDGATGAKFLQTFRQYMENPALMLA
jgi:pyruvate dehydrogenase E2 component (dihydrolipoamide acetyltransferase)